MFDLKNEKKINTKGVVFGGSNAWQMCHAFFLQQQQS